MSTGARMDNVAGSKTARMRRPTGISVTLRVAMKPMMENTRAAEGATRPHFFIAQMAPTEINPKIRIAPVRIKSPIEANESPLSSVYSVPNTI